MKENWYDLYTKYPALFANKNKTIQESCMAFGIECSTGWSDILYLLCSAITQHEKNLDYNPELKGKYTPVTFDQIKEKWGGLRVYYSGGDEYVEGLVSMAEAMSYRICELCGKPGKPTKGGWIITLCEDCLEKEEKRKETEDANRSA